ncbi:hypothetical protein VCCP1040_1694, partial [Vibrio cholerae CP1040(13)]
MKPQTYANFAQIEIV